MMSTHFALRGQNYYVLIVWIILTARLPHWAQLLDLGLSRDLNCCLVLFDYDQTKRV